MTLTRIEIYVDREDGVRPVEAVYSADSPHCTGDVYTGWVDISELCRRWRLTKRTLTKRTLTKRTLTKRTLTKRRHIMNDVVKQAVAKASKPFLNSVSEMLGHEFTAEERLELCGELEMFMAATIFLVREIPDEDMEDSEVVEEALGMTSPALAKAILAVAGKSPEGFSGKLTAHVRAFFTLVSLLMMAKEADNGTDKQ